MRSPSSLVATAAAALPSRANRDETSPEDIVKRALDGLESGLDEVLADERTKFVKQGLNAPTPSRMAQHRRAPAHAA